jgi:hypothetical protein
VHCVGLPGPRPESAGAVETLNPRSDAEFHAICPLDAVPGYHSLIAARDGFLVACTNSFKNDYARPHTKTNAVFEKEIKNAEHRQKTVSFTDRCITGVNRHRYNWQLAAGVALMLDKSL